MPDYSPAPPPPTPHALARLARRTGHRDPAAFVALYRALHDPVHARIAACVPDERRAREVMCATFVEVARMARFHCGPDDDVRAWIDAVTDARIAEALAGPGDEQWWVDFATMRAAWRYVEFGDLWTTPGR